MTVRVAWIATVRPSLDMGWVELDVTQAAELASVMTRRPIVKRGCVPDQDDGEYYVADPDRL